jgi:hypothetical protein
MEEKMIRQSKFTSGELDFTVWKRTEAEEYLSGAQQLFNCEIATVGLVKKRKGTTQVGVVTAHAIAQSHMYEIVDQNNNHYVAISNNGSFSIYQKVGLTLTFIQTLTTPYQTADLNDIDYTQDNDSLVLTHPLYPPSRIFVSAYNNPLPPTFAFQNLNIYPYPAYDFNTINYNATTVSLSVTGNTLTITFSGLPAGATYTNAWIGGQIVGTGLSETQPIGYAIITAVSQTGTAVTFTATIQLPFETTGYPTSGSQYSIKQPAWSAALGYPACCLFFQNRLWLANTISLNNTLFGSRINSPINYDVGTGADTDAIVYTIGQTGSGSILWLNGGKQLEIFCQNNEFACPQDQNSALTPGTFAIRQQSSYGALVGLKPITYLNDSYYVTRSGNSIINFRFNGIGLTYISSNISAASTHLVKNPINRSILQGDTVSQDNFIYFLNNDNSITAFQFASEYKLAALTPCAFQAFIDVIDIATIDNTVCILKNYTQTGAFTIEQFDEAQRIDGAVTATMGTNGVITGLDIYDGYTVQVVFENQDFGEYLVVGGSITVANPHALSGSATVGFLYLVVITPMYPLSGAVESPFFKHVTRIYVDYYNTLDFQINGNLVPYQNFAAIQAGLPIFPQSDTAIVTPFSGWNRFNNTDGSPIISITQSAPFDLQITGISYQIESDVI